MISQTMVDGVIAFTVGSVVLGTIMVIFGVFGIMITFVWRRPPDIVEEIIDTLTTLGPLIVLFGGIISGILIMIRFAIGG